MSLEPEIEKASHELAGDGQLPQIPPLTYS